MLAIDGARGLVECCLADVRRMPGNERDSESGRDRPLLTSLSDDASSKLGGLLQFMRNKPPTIIPATGLESLDCRRTISAWPAKIVPGFDPRFALSSIAWVIAL